MSRTPSQILDDCCTELNAKGQAHISGLLHQIKQQFVAMESDRDAIIDVVEPTLIDGVWTGTVAEAVQATISRLTAERGVVAGHLRDLLVTLEAYFKTHPNSIDRSVIIARLEVLERRGRDALDALATPRDTLTERAIGA